jgi:hypothetical protein
MFHADQSSQIVLPGPLGEPEMFFRDTINHPHIYVCVCVCVCVYIYIYKIN